MYVGGDYPTLGSAKTRDITVPSPASLNRIVASPGSMSLPQYAGLVCFEILVIYLSSLVYNV